MCGKKNLQKVQNVETNVFSAKKFKKSTSDNVNQNHFLQKSKRERKQPTKADENLFYVAKQCKQLKCIFLKFYLFFT